METMETTVEEAVSNGEVLKTAIVVTAMVVASVYIKRALFRSIARATLKELDKREANV